MHNLDLILTLAAGLAGALVFGYGTHRLGWSPIVGYLLAGVLVGPHTPGFVANSRIAGQLAEVGVILLMFGVGLHFHVKDLLRVGRAAVAGAVVQSTIATVLGALAAQAFGWNWRAGIVFGLALSVASTVVLTRVLSDNGELQSPTGRIAIGWLVVEDIFTVFILVLLPVVFGSRHHPAGLVLAIAVMAGKLALLIAFILLGGARALPWLLHKVAATHSRELFTLCVLAIALGIAVCAAYFFGVSVALGAFLAGIVVGQSEFSARAGAEALPMRDAFAVMFFLSVGMLLDPRHVLDSPLTLAALAIVVAGKPLAALCITTLLGYGSRVALGVAIGLAQIGEFSFLLAAVGIEAGVLPADAMNPLVVAAIVSIMLNPLLYRAVVPIESALARRPRLWRPLNRAAGRIAEDAAVANDAAPVHRAVIVGYGPIGRTVSRLLRERGIQPTVIEMNIDTHRHLSDQGDRAVYGDANQRTVLEQAGIARAASLILSASGSATSTEAIRAAREINPGVYVIARADFLAQAESLRAAQADEVFSGEGELALAITGSVLRHLGATPGQLDEERERIRTELLRKTGATQGT